MRSLGALVLTVAVMALTGNLSAEEKAYVSKDNEEIYGTWVNKEYEFIKSIKHVVYSDGTWGWAMSERQPPQKGPYEINEKWTDPEGNIWYKVRLGSEVWGQKKKYVLMKINNSGKIRESNWENDEYPTKIDPNRVGYRIDYRQ